MRTRLLVFAAVAAAALVGTGADCHRRLFVHIVSASENAGAGEPVTISVCTEPTSDSLWVNYVINWGDDSTETTSQYYLATDTVQFTHTWNRVGTFYVGVEHDLDIRYADGSHGRCRSEGDMHSIVVTGGWNSPPVIDELTGPGYTAIGVPTRFRVGVHDPDGDSLRITFEWGDDSATTTPLLASPCTASVAYAYQRTDTVLVRAWAVDVRGMKSAVVSRVVCVGAAGAVMDYWINNDDDEASLITSLVYVSNGSEDCVWGTCEDDYNFYGLTVSSMRSAGTGSTAFPEYVFTGHPAFCAATFHFIVGSEEGELYALKLGSLSKEWRYPNKPREESITGIEWGAPAINGNRIYIPQDNDSMFYFTDNIGTVTRNAAYYVGASVVDAPIIDASGNILFGTDSGYLYKLDGNSLGFIWRTPLQGNGEIHGPVLDADGTIFCTSDSARVYAVNPSDGSVKWMITTNGEGTRPVVAADGIYLGTSTGRFYKLDKATGTPQWDSWLGSSEFATTPILAGTDYLYAQNDRDVLYCVQRSNGQMIWACDCPAAMPRKTRARTMQLVDYLPNPTIAAEGNIIVVGSDAVFKVKGYPERTLDATAPWPKWQHDLYNTGNVGGGR